MKSLLFSAALFAAVVNFVGAAEGDLPQVAGVVAGWDREAGRVLLGELNCAGCHPAGDAPVTSKQPPILAEAGSRLTPQFLRKFLADPHGVKPGTTMPNVLHALSADERAKQVEALTHYLTTLGPPLDPLAAGASQAQIAQGRELYHTVGCIACHAPSAPPPKHKIDPTAPRNTDDEDEVPAAARPAVPHGPLALKTTVAELTKFLSDPLHTRPSGRMPSLNLRPGEPASIAAYLLRDQYTPDQQSFGAGVKWTYWQKNFNRTSKFDGEKPTADGTADRIALDVVQLPGGGGPKNQFGVKFEGLIEIERPGKYLFALHSDDGSTLKIGDKLVVDHDGDHSPSEKSGEVELTAGRHPFELRMFNSGGGFELNVRWQPPGATKLEPLPTGVLLTGTAAMIPLGTTEFTVDANLAAEGKKLFTSLGCANCHVVDRAEAVRAPSNAIPLTKLNPEKAESCLAAKPGANRARYDLSEAQRNAVASAVNNLAEKPAAADKLAHSLASFRCYSCHARGGQGGPDPARFDYFTYETPVDLGDEGRTPPPLNETGVKLTALGFDDMLVNGKRYRTYMATRMPQFGKNNVGHLPELFTAADAGKIPAHQPVFNAKLAEDGRKLVGKKGAACVNCHAWGGLRLPGAEGLDLLYAPQRLQAGWFRAWLSDPQQLKPRTRMPTVWSPGQKPYPQIQDGDRDRQIDAIWTYLAAGEKGGLPNGLFSGEGEMLAPIDEPLVFRTFLDQHSAHAILVGFPQRTHVAFDANRVRMLAAWSGNFVSTAPAWEGRAGNYAKIPSPNPVLFAAGPPFAKLDSLDEKWPDDVPKTKGTASRTPPNWKFHGYRFDADRGPTFLYSIGVAEVEETPRTEVRPGASTVTRRVKLTADKSPEGWYFKVAEGKTIATRDGGFVVDEKVTYRVTTGGAPSVRVQGDKLELILPLKFAPATRGAEALVETEVSW